MQTENCSKFTSQHIDSGFGSISGDVGYLVTTLATLDITLAAPFWAWGKEDILAHLIEKTYDIPGQPGGTAAPSGEPWT